MLGGLVTTQPLYHRKETWYLEYKKLGEHYGYLDYQEISGHGQR